MVLYLHNFATFIDDIFSMNVTNVYIKECDITSDIVTSKPKKYSKRRTT